MFDLPDVATLRQCSILCSAAYTVVFFAMGAGGSWYRYWGWGAFSYCASLILAGLIGEPLPLWTLVLTDGVLSFSMALVLAGVRRFDGERGFVPWMWIVVAVTAVVPSVALTVVGAGAVAAAVWSLTMALSSFALAVPLIRNRATDGTARPRRLAGCLLSLYAPVYLTVAVGALVTQQLAQLLEAIPYLADQLLFGAANLALLWIPTARAQQQLRDTALRDPLTGLGNRAALAAGAAELLVPGRVALLIDVDRFKTINDRHGHAVGDRVLVAIADALRRSTGGDFVARLGGDEFLVVTDADDPTTAAEQIHRRAGRSEAGLPPWTLSIGAARIEPGDRSIDDVIQRADMLMYRAKDRGRTAAAA
ncbi:GGDEF domain-containing protein [uncultured Sphingomonas sp.]|uniref:GGDEF domain-containing protein n=1 Tax=uncultured Sphingomonas sp. TaxID=158754 RepID=UPI0025EA9A5E|nr:GGDEF domain-containing protein [uncultured Sphingomonas sp.]